ncbi:antitoxin [Methylobacterium sp. J-072]|uniref:type II toxin-antitoxin system VapB family antitoxin n=1 Tax=Methylobacterium sp. J-072 TaxID=2836651 RepID=UPI001FB90CE0|nr:type II toxin-antitoxin system VapB family antitoxin [Methylobacterium sp. J-072]MCJ2096249.1 antitoxin [Methylobacterium sp. J-072]
MAGSTVYTCDHDQLVLLPEAVAFPVDVRRVDILKIGRSRVLVPQGERWDNFFLNGPRVSDDFMVERDQPDAQDWRPMHL